jgi:3-hydroxyisobutyrate dehydrogenase-like beta-hydroxyacid dehydrogenase
MAANILKAGYPLTIYNRTIEKTAALEKAGASVAFSPRVLAENTDVIVVMVTGPEAMDDLLWGPEGAAKALDGNKCLINMSSVPPMFTREFNDKLAPTGVTFIDAPVSGSKKPAEDGTLLILAGGSKEAVEEFTPLLETMGKKVIYCGETGQGSMMKMANNLLLASVLEAMAEVVNFGKMGGLSQEALFDVIGSGPMNCPIIQMKTGMFRENEFPPNFPLKHMTKDLKFLVDTAYQTGAPVPVGHALLHLYRLGVGREWGDLDVAAILKVLEYMNEKRGNAE